MAVTFGARDWQIVRTQAARIAAYRLPLSAKELTLEPPARQRR